MTQEELERIVIELFLSYGDEVSEQLLEQSKELKVKKRDYTGVGFFTYFDSPQNTKNNNINKTYRDLSIDFVDSKGTMNFALYIQDGEIDCLEGIAFGDDWWPEDIKKLDRDSFYGGGKSAFL